MDSLLGRCLASRWTLLLFARTSRVLAGRREQGAGAGRDAGLAGDAASARTAVTPGALDPELGHVWTDRF